MAASIPACTLRGPSVLRACAAGPGEVVDGQGDLEDRVGVRLAVLAVHEVGELVHPAGEVAAVGGQPLLAAVEAEGGPLLGGGPGALDGLADGVRVVHREDADDGVGGRVRSTRRSAVVACRSTVPAEASVTVSS